jgi:serine protease inhibitor
MKRFLIPVLLAGMLPAADSHVETDMNSFTVELYKRVSGPGGDLILSPFNVGIVLSMILAGARGQTANEMRHVLHLQDESNYQVSLAALVAGLAKSGNAEGNELVTANGLWVQKGFEIRPAFERTLESDFQAPLTAVDFRDAETARSRINGWTEERTKGRIKNLFPARSLDSQMRLVLTSAIYFYGAWQTPFVTARTRPAPFTLPTGVTKEVDFMNQTSHFDYTETPAAQILQMRYSGTGFAFDVLLPKTATGLPGLEHSLTSDALAGWLGKLSSRNVQLSLPKFHAESGLSLERTLATMGMPAVFTNSADLSGISSKPGLMVSKVVHQAFVDVAERGTEAAAASGAAIAGATARPPEPTVVFRADHPFLFLVRDTRSEAILFIGRLTNPQ